MFVVVLTENRGNDNDTRRPQPKETVRKVSTVFEANRQETTIGVIV